MEVSELLQSRKENFLKVVNHQKADWLPLLSINNMGSLAYAGISYWKLERDFDNAKKAMSKVYEELPADVSAGDGVSQNGRCNQILRGCTQTKVTEDGFNLQHLQTTVMNGDEYAELMKDIPAFVKNVMLPRRYPFLFEMDPKEAAKIVISVLEENTFCMATGPFTKTKQYVEDVYGIYHFGDKRFRCSTPGDYIFDQFRGFTGTLTDLRRHYEEMKALCDLLWEKNYCNHFQGLEMSSEMFPSYMAHIPAFLNPKQYNDLCYKYFKQQIEGMTKSGSKLFMLAEGTWGHLFDYFLDLPKDSVIMVLENDDMIESYKKLGHHQILAGGAPICNLRLSSKEENIDNAKRVVDACGGPESGYIFSTDKAWSCAGDINQNLIEVFKFVHEYGQY